MDKRYGIVFVCNEGIKLGLSDGEITDNLIWAAYGFKHRDEEVSESSFEGVKYGNLEVSVLGYEYPLEIA